MQVWIDGDACPGPVKEVVFRCALKRRVPTVLVANQVMRVPRSSYVSIVVVSGDFDAADHHIIQEAVVGDLVITADIPLAHALVEAGIVVISPRGEIFTASNIGERLATRNLMAELRSGGLVQGGPPAYAAQEKAKFANVFDAQVTRLLSK